MNFSLEPCLSHYDVVFFGHTFPPCSPALYGKLEELFFVWSAAPFPSPRSRINPPAFFFSEPSFRFGNHPATHSPPAPGNFFILSAVAFCCLSELFFLCAEVFAFPGSS